MNYWLMKSEPGECSIDTLQQSPRQNVSWTGVRNYQARNFMRDLMRVGDGVLFYHSSCPEPGIAGLAEVSGLAYPDPSQFDPMSPYFDAKSPSDAPRWLSVDVGFVRKTALLPLKEMRSNPSLAGMIVLQAHSRLSITPVTPDEWSALLEVLEPQ